MSRSKRSPEAVLLEAESEKLQAFDGGSTKDTFLLTFALFVLNWTLWDGPGVTRPYPGSSVALGGCCALLSIATINNRMVGQKLRIAHALGLALLGWLTLSAAFSYDRFLSYQSLASWVGAVGIFVLVSSSTTSLLRWRYFLGGICLSTAVLCVRGMSAFTKDGLTATFSNHDTFSVVPLLALFLCLSQLDHQNPLIRNVGRILLLFFALTVVRTASRAAVLGLCLGFIITGLLPQGKRAISHQKERLRRKALLVLACLVPAIGLMMGLFSPLLERISETSSGKDVQGVTMRVDVLVNGLRAAREHPVLGAGPGAFALAYQEYRPQSLLPDYIYVNVAHNDFIEVLVEFGVVGALLVSLQLGLAFMRASRLLRGGMLAWETRCLCGGLVALLVFCSLNFAVAVPALLFLASAVLGLLQGLPGAARIPREKRSGPAAVFRALGLLVWGGWATVFGVKAFLAQNELKVVENLTRALRWEEALPKLSAAIRLQPRNPALYLARGNLNFQLAKFQKDKPHYAAEARADLELAGQLSPRDHKVLTGRLNFYRAQQDWPQAELVYRQLQKMRPYGGYDALGLCRILLAEGKFEEAAQALWDGALDDPDSRKMMVGVLVELERRKPGHAVSLMGNWSSTSGGVDSVPKVLEACLEQAVGLSDRTVAERFLDFAQEKMPDNTKVLFLGYRLSKSSGDSVRMKKFLDKLLSLDSKSSRDQDYLDQAWVEWARSQPDYRNQGPLVGQLRERLKRQPKSIVLRLEMAQILLRNNEVDAATELITRGLELVPEQPALLARMGTCVARQGLPALAKDYYEQALKGDPRNAEAKRGLRGPK